MKTIHKILLATAAAASFTWIDRAADVVMPPRAWENQPVIVPGQNNDPDLLQYNANGNAKMAEQMASTAMAQNANSDRDPDLLSYPTYYSSMSPKMLQERMESGRTGNYASQQDPNLVGPYYAETESR